ncbi:MAG: NAD(P)H-hydrate dehydratase [Bacteroidales bacterium]|nr:NAD(P)H-hydrate dehydratase [Bacteroidales bacterium]
MKIFSSAQVREIDAYTIKNEPIPSIDLMERAALRLFEWISNKFKTSYCFKIFAGPGNNGGDVLALARMLAVNNYKVEVFILKLKELSNDAKINYTRLQEQNLAFIKCIETEKDFPVIYDDEIIIDGLFGSGLDRPLSGMVSSLVKYLNTKTNCVISIDIPSGLFGEDNCKNDKNSIIKAEYTLSFQFPKLSFLFPENDIYIGKWEILPIGLHNEIIAKIPSHRFYFQEDDIARNLKHRSKFSHKGNYGHALLISGSYGKMGAAVLASKACLRTGVGLLTAHIPKSGYNIIQTAVPEAMASIDISDSYFTDCPETAIYSAVGVGPGIGLEKPTQKAFSGLLGKTKSPLVVDADGLNILAENKELLILLPENSILTPHPKEFERLAGKSSDNYSQLNLLLNFSKEYNVFVILKRAHTVIACPDGTCYFNSTGNPGMATGGSGDVLTGIILSLLAQDYNPKFAAIIGVYLHGLAGDIAAFKIGKESLIAGDIIEFLPEAFLKIKGFTE